MKVSSRPTPVVAFPRKLVAGHASTLVVLTGSSQVGLPLFGNPGHRIHNPRQLARRLRRMRQFHSRFFRRAVSFSQIATTARCNHVVPLVLSTARSRQDVVDAVSDSPAVATNVIITGKHCSTRHCGTSLIRNFHHVAKSNYYW